MDQHGRVNDKLIFESKVWVPLLEAVDYLSESGKYKIFYRDLLNYAIREKIELSLMLSIGTKGRLCQVVEMDAMNSSNFNCADTNGILNGYFWESENKFIKPIDDVTMFGLEDDHSLIMVGRGLCELKEMAIQRSDLACMNPIFGCKSEEFYASSGVIVKNKEGKVFELMEQSLPSYEIKGESDKTIIGPKRPYYPMLRLPLHISPLGVRTKELLRFENTIRPASGVRQRSKGKDLTAEKEERFCEVEKYNNENLLTLEEKGLIKTVFKMAVDHFSYAPELKRSPVPREIADAVTLLFDDGISDDTVRYWLKVAAEKEKCPNFNIASKKSLLKIFFTIVDKHFDISDNNTSTDIPEDLLEEIVASAASAGAELTTSTVKKWLNEAARLKNSLN